MQHRDDRRFEASSRVLAMVATGCLAMGIADARAQQDSSSNYPARAIRVIAAVPAGGGVDTVMRLVAQGLQRRLGQPVVVENRGGASGNIGAEAVANAAPDGYTLLAAAPAPLAINAALYKNLNYDAAAFAPVIVMARSPNVLVVNPNLPVKSAQDLIAYAKANPRKLTYASQGNATTSHLTAALFEQLTQTQLLHVPYRGTTPALNDLIGSHVDLMFVDVTAVLALHQSGKARILAIASQERLAELPDIPTFGEVGVMKFFSSSWSAVAAPPKTPETVTSKLNTEINAVLGMPEIETHFRDLHLTRMGGSPADMTEFLNAERRRWEDVVRSANITLD